MKFFWFYLQAYITETQEEDASHEQLVDWSGVHEEQQLSGQQANPSDQYIKLEDGTYSCCTCYKQFRGRFMIMRHILIHTGEKPYSCFNCDYRAVQKNQLLVHCTRHHSMTKAHFEALLKAREDNC